MFLSVVLICVTCYNKYENINSYLADISKTKRRVKMKALRNRTITSVIAMSIALLSLPMFQTAGNAAGTRLSISECKIKDKTMTYTGKTAEGEVQPVTVMARSKDNPADIRYMRIITPNEDGSFADSIKLHDSEITADLFDMEVLFQADEENAAERFVLTYFNDMKKIENINKMKASSKGMLEFMATDAEGMKIYDNMGVRLDLYNAQSAEEKQKTDNSANAYKSSADADNVVEIANGSVYSILAGGANSAELRNIILGFDAESKELRIKKNNSADSERYSELSTEAQKWIAENVYANKPKDGFESYREFYKAIRRSMLLRFINTTHYMELSDMILANTDILENEMSNLKNETRTKVLDAAMSNVRQQAEKSGFTQTSRFIEAVNAALTKAANEGGSNTEGGSGTPTGGNSGGGGSGRGNGSGVNMELNPNSGNGNNSDNNNKFKDLAGYEWAADAIEKLAERGIVSGIAPESFEPGRSITREEFVKLICSAFNFGTSDAISAFEDISESDWFAPYVSRAVELGIISGISDTRFGTGLCITREDMAAIIHRALEKSGVEMTAGGKSFADGSSIAEYAKQPVSILSGNGIISGMGNDEFQPKANAKRAEAAVIIYRCMAKLIA